MIELPLCAVRMIRIGSLPRRNPQNLDIKGMPLVQVCGLRLAAQLLRNFFASADEFSLGRRPSYFNDLCCVHLVHGWSPNETELSHRWRGRARQASGTVS